MLLPVALTTVLVIVGASGAPLAARALQTGESPAPPSASPEAMLERGILEKAPNTVLLDYLLEEGGRNLSPQAQQEAIQQAASALREETEERPTFDVSGEGGWLPTGMKEMLQESARRSYNPENVLRTVLGVPGSSGAGREQIEEMQAALTDPWARGIEAASALRQAGYTEDARAFFRACLETSYLPEGWLTERCLEGAMTLGPEEAEALFGGLLENAFPLSFFDGMPFAMAGRSKAELFEDVPPIPRIQAVGVLGLGRLAADDRVGPDRRSAIVDILVRQARGSREPQVLQATVHALARAGGERSAKALRRLWKEGEPKGIRPIAGQALVAVHRHPRALRELGERLREGEPAESYPIAMALMEASEEAGFAWAEEFLGREGVSKEEEDLRARLVRELEALGSPRALEILRDLASGELGDEWLQAVATTALVASGELQHIDRLETLAGKTDWDLDRGGAGSWFKRLKPLLWAGLQLAAGMPADQRVLLDFTFAERDRRRELASEKERRTSELRWQIADALAEVDDPRSLPILRDLLRVDDSSVRLSAANALLAQSATLAAETLAGALELDYGEQAGRSVNPEVHAAILRKLLRAYPEHPRTEAFLAGAESLEEPSLRFMALTARSGPWSPTAPG